MLGGILSLTLFGVLAAGWYLLTRSRRTLLRSSETLRRDLSAGHNASNAQSSAETSATALVKGIAFHNEITLFLHNDKAHANENEQIILDLLETLDLAPKVVDVSTDSDLHLGIPLKDGEADIPYLYIDGLPFGGAAEILDAVSNGKLAEKLSAAKIAFNRDSATQMMRV